MISVPSNTEITLEQDWSKLNLRNTFPFLQNLILYVSEICSVVSEIKHAHWETDRQADAEREREREGLTHTA